MRFLSAIVVFLLIGCATTQDASSVIEEQCWDQSEVSHVESNVINELCFDGEGRLSVYFDAGVEEINACLTVSGQNSECDLNQVDYNCFMLDRGPFMAIRCLPVKNPYYRLLEFNLSKNMR